MSVSTIYAPIEYAGDAVTVEFPVPWMFLEAAHLLLWKVDDSDDSETAIVGFTAAGVGDEVGGSVTVSEPIGVGFTLRIERYTERTQELDLTPQGRFPAESLERAYDKLTLIVQELDVGDGTGGQGLGNLVITTDNPENATVSKTDNVFTISVTNAEPVGPAGGDLSGTYPDPIVRQLTGVGADLLAVETDFASWEGLAHGATLGGRGIAAGYIWVGGVHVRAWGAQEAYGWIHWTTDNWATSVLDSSLITYFGAPNNHGTFPTLKYLYMAGIGKNAWVCTRDNGFAYYAPDEVGNFEADGTIKSTAWVELDTGTILHLIADIGVSGSVACVVGNHNYISRTEDWNTFTDVYGSGSTPVIGGIDTDRYGNWVAIERDTGKVLFSDDDGLTFAYPSQIWLDGAPVAALNPVGAVAAGNGIWLAAGSTWYGYSYDGLNWFSGTNELGSFYGLGFDGVRFYATDPDALVFQENKVFQLLVGEIPAHRTLVAERGIVIAEDAWLPDLPSAEMLGTDENGRFVAVKSPASFIVEQVAHGFTVGQFIYHNGSAFALAQADDVATVARFVVVSVPDADTFLMADRAAWVLGGTPSGVVYLSETVAGGWTTTPPTDLSQPLGWGDGTRIHISISKQLVATSEPMGTPQGDYIVNVVP